MNNHNGLIMSLLEKRGLDKRFRDNPEAVSQICNLINGDIFEETGKSAQLEEGSEIEKTVIRILERYDVVDSGDNRIRNKNFYTINEDGSLSVKHKTYVDKSGGYTRRSDLEQIFTIGKEKGDLIVTENSEDINQAEGDTLANRTIKFNIFNSNGLEIQSKEISQSIKVDSSFNIANVGDAFNAISRVDVKSTLEPVTETIIDRGSDLATARYYRIETKNCIMRAKEIVDNNKNKDAISNPEPISNSLRGYPTGKTINEIVPNIPSGSNLNYLTSPYDAETWVGKTDEEKKSGIQTAYDVLATSEAFRETILDSAKTNPELQEVVKRLNLVRTANENDAHVVNVGDLEKIYEGVSDKEHRTTMQTIIETSREVDDEKESNKMEK